MIVRKQVKFKVPSQQQDDRDLYLEEMRCLRLLHRLQHPNIVRFLGSYTYKDEKNFLFPCYDQDLNDFLKLDVRPEAFKDDYAFFEALYGVASALQNLHELKLNAPKHGVEVASIGYHHDLRPENILIEGRKFLLADFGLSKIKDHKQTSRTAWKAGIGDYIAPECINEDLSHRRVGRSIDIWAFGCLVAEVLTYLELGNVGVSDFQKSRSSAETLSNFEDQYFFGSNEVKTNVLEWLKQLASRSKSAVIQYAIGLVQKILQFDLRKRCTIEEIVQALAMCTTRAHFIAVQQAFAQHLDLARRSKSEGISFMKSWFENERVNALSTVLGSLSKDSTLSSLLSEVPDLPQRSQILFDKLLSLLRNHGRQATLDNENDMESRTQESGQMFDAELQSIVHQIWILFPFKYQRRMELAWHQTALHTNNLEQLSSSWIRSEGPNDPQYHEISALAAMKALRLHFVQQRTEQASKDYFIPYSDDILLEKMDDHSVFRYNGKRVLIEWEYYDPKWDRMTTEKKALLMSLKAEGLGIKPKPPQLKILNCLGFIEKLTGRRRGYGFLYAFPSVENERLTSLLSLMKQDEKERKMSRHPLLGQKFNLAATLVTCVHEIHAVGWVHENINSHNVVFFNSLAGPHPPSHATVDNAYIVDFRRSRPDSNVWYTMGPSEEDDHIDYRHPDYERGGRFHRVYDYYSIGIVLLEIGLWKPLSNITEKMRTDTPTEMRSKLIQGYVPRLGFLMGPIYRDVVLACLRGDFQVSDAADSSDTEDFKQFAEIVVEPLEGLARVSL